MEHLFLSSGPHPKMSNRYVSFNTQHFINQMGEMGWVVGKVSAPKSKNDPYCKHSVRLRKDGEPFILGELISELVFTNSYNGKSAVEAEFGFFRPVCSNGLIVSDTTLNVSFRHDSKLKTVQLEELVEEFFNELPTVQRRIEILKESIPTERQKIEFINGVFDLRGLNYDDATLKDLLNPTRPEDANGDAWGFFNHIQETVIGGGFQYKTPAGRVRKAKPIKNFTRDMGLNREMWAKAEEVLV
jgi:Domain of unknown function (DUF932).